MKTASIKINNLVFDCQIHGNPNDALILFLHGFPETSHMWIPLMEKIALDGYFCVAPNLRGYSKYGCPKGKKHYTIDKLCDDIHNISAYFKKDKFHLIAHDWGAVIGWHFVHDNPDKIVTWTSLSVPHITAFREVLLSSEDQQKRSRYIKLFQWPYLPEYRIRKNDFAVFRRMWKHSTESEVNAYLKVFRVKACLTAALNYYRANFGKDQSKSIGKINVPTLFIWGNKDIAIGKESVSNGHNYMPKAYSFIELNSGHWLIQSSFDDVFENFRNHLTSFGC